MLNKQLLQTGWKPASKYYSDFTIELKTPLSWTQTTGWKAVPTTFCARLDCGMLSTCVLHRQAYSLGYLWYLYHTTCRNCKRSTSHRIGCPGRGHAAGVVFLVFVSNNSSEGNSDFQLLVELLAALSDPAHFFLIHLHLDSSPDLKDSVIQIVKQLPQAAWFSIPLVYLGQV